METAKMETTKTQVVAEEATAVAEMVAKMAVVEPPIQQHRLRRSDRIRRQILQIPILPSRPKIPRLPKKPIPSHPRVPTYPKKQTHRSRRKLPIH